LTPTSGSTEVIAGMVDQWRQGFDVVYGVRSDRAGETAIKLATASMFYRLLGRLTNVPHSCQRRRLPVE
jgi:dolichol-phosphate mannosyltransferase